MVACRIILLLSPLCIASHAQATVAGTATTATQPPSDVNLCCVLAVIDHVSYLPISIQNYNSS